MSEFVRSIGGSEWAEDPTEIVRDRSSYSISQRRIMSNRKMKSIVLVWEDRPETHRFFVVPLSEINGRLRVALRESHYKFINMDECTESMKIVQAAVTKDDEDTDSEFLQWSGKFIPFERSPEVTIEGCDIEAFFLSGFCM